jgi:DNA-binding NarL/FixJ family response regulator
VPADNLLREVAACGRGGAVVKHADPADGPAATALSILIADDHAIVREGLKRLLESSGRSWHVVEAGSGFEALDILRRQRFDLAIVDLSMPGLGGLELLDRVRAMHPGMLTMVLTMRAEEQYALRAFQAGARGFVTKDVAGKELVVAVEKVVSGGLYVSPAVADLAVMQLSGVAPPASLDRLSDRELDVLRRLVGGARPGEIAKALHLSIKTISSHKSRIQEKLRLANTAALIRFGLENGLGADDAGPASER